MLPQLKGLIKRTLPDSAMLRLQATDHWFFGEEELRLLPYLCDRSKVSLDIGANIGTYAYFMRRWSKHLIAYEPNPQLARRLARLLPDVAVRHVAVSDGQRPVTLRIPVRDGREMHELASVAQSFEADQVVEHQTMTVAIDDDDSIDDVGFIKIDVEQHEIAVLKGAMNTIRRCRPAIMTEVTPLLYPASLPETFRFVLDEGYTGWFRIKGKYLPLTAFNASAHANAAHYGTADFMANNVIFLPDGSTAMPERLMSLAVFSAFAHVPPGA